MKKNNIYIVLVKAHTGLGKFVRKITKYEYTHIAVSLDDNFNKFYTFSRKNHYTPFDSGYMIETLDCYAYGKHENIKLKIFKIPVEDIKEIESYINSISKDKEYIFNLYSMITMPLLNGFRIYKSHNCMSFTSKIIELSNKVKLTKPYYKYSIKEIDNLLSKYLYKEDIFTKDKIDNPNYMKKINIFKNIISFIKLNITLIYRLIMKGCLKNED